MAFLAEPHKIGVLLLLLLSLPLFFFPYKLLQENLRTLCPSGRCLDCGPAVPSAGLERGGRANSIKRGTVGLERTAAVHMPQGFCSLSSKASILVAAAMKNLQAFPHLIFTVTPWERPCSTLHFTCEKTSRGKITASSHTATTSGFKQLASTCSPPFLHSISVLQILTGRNVFQEIGNSVFH